MENSFIKNRNIIIVGQQPWDVPIGSNCKNIAIEFSKQNRVLYVNSPLDRISSLKDRKQADVRKRLNVIKGKENGLVQLNPNLWNLYPDCLVESLNWISIDFLFDWINKRNNKKFADSIKRAAKQLSFSNYILFNDNEIMKCFYLKKLLNPDIGIYYSRDYILATPYWKKHGERLEPQVIADNDLCLANSPYLASYCKKYNPNSWYVGQGCEIEIFKNNQSAPPEDITKIRQPRIGYVGALLSNRLDIETLTYIAESRPQWNIILVGPEDADFQSSRLHGFTNVFFTGPRPVDELPAYVAAFDVCINPQIVNQLTIGNYPRKIDEYLAMGKPVVATRTATMEIFKDYVFLAEGKEDYCALLELALTENSVQKEADRKNFAATHTWENSVGEIYKSIIRWQKNYKPNQFIVHRNLIE